MIRKYKNYIIFALILIILTGIYVLVSLVENGGNNLPETSSTAVMLYDIIPEDITKIKIENETGGYTFLYDKNIRVEGKEKIDIDEELVKSLRNHFSIISADNTVNENAENLSDYGLVNPKISATVTEKNGEITTIYLGKKSPVDDSYYMKKDDENKVYILSSVKSEMFLRKLDYYRNTVLMSVTEENVTQLSFEKADGMRVTIKRNPVDENGQLINSYYIFKMSEPYDWDVIDSEVSKIISSLSGFVISDYISDNPEDISVYGFNPYYARITVSQKDGKNYDILIGNSIDSKFYVKLKNAKEIYTADASAFSYLNLKPEAFLQPFAYIRGIDTVKKLVYNYKDEIKAEFEIKKISDGEHDIKRNGKLVSQSSFKSMYTELISMEIGGQIDYNLNKKPVLTYEFHFTNGGKDVICYYEFDERKLAVSINNKIQFYVDKNQFENRINKINEIIKNEL